MSPTYVDTVYNVLFSISSSKSTYNNLQKAYFCLFPCATFEHDFRIDTLFIVAFGLFVARQAKILIDVLNVVRARVLCRLMAKAPKKTLIMF